MGDQSADALSCIQLGELLGVVGTFDRLLECFSRYRRVLPFHVVAEGLLLGAVPGALAWGRDDPVLGVQFVEVVGQALGQHHVGRVKAVGLVVPPTEEKELPVEQAQRDTRELLTLR